VPVRKTTAAAGSTATWYLRSYRDQDTHVASAIAADGTVTSHCGAIFVPMLRPIDVIPARLSAPPDELQICPRCRGGAT
jgi:hypothetical protein